ncbi:MAG: hypothetical protein GQ574_09185 [Crocinitomix sp.]|nr:hypothetical protein [Crocinitomix sp.]
MKTLFSFILVCLASVQSFADCGASGIYVWPATNSSISEMPVITVEGYYIDQELVRKIGKDYNLYLKSANHLVRLIPVEILEGDMYLTQVVLKPVQLLKPDEEYELYTSSFPKKTTTIPETLELGIPKSKWTVRASNDKSAPVFTTTPKWIKSNIFYWGCGPGRSMKFEFETKEVDNFLVRTTLTNTADSSKTTYYIAATEGIISVGHGMCSGAFIPKEDVKYKVEFSLLDGSWNKGKTVSCELVYKPENPY